MASEATPRINAKYLESFTNQTVRILGKVVSLRGETATVDANGSINVHLNRVCTAPANSGGERDVFVHVKIEADADSQDAHLSLNNAVELVGKVQQDLSVKVYQATDFGSNIGNESPWCR